MKKIFTWPVKLVFILSAGSFHQITDVYIYDNPTYSFKDWAEESFFLAAIFFIVGAILYGIVSTFRKPKKQQPFLLHVLHYTFWPAIIFIGLILFDALILNAIL